MKATELMIGDWVEFHQSDGQGFYAQVEALNNDGTFSESGVYADNDVSPIPLTAEILEKNGFFIIGDNASYKEAAEYYGKEAELNVVYHKLSGHLQIQRMVYYYIGREQHEDWCNLLHIHTLYVHEFQHALKLCGIKKDIEL